MVNSAFRHDATLAEVLSSRARSASDLRLMLDAIVGVAVVSVALVLRPYGWFFLFSAATCFASFGLWGIADRELNDPVRQLTVIVATLLKAVRVIAAVAGGIAAVALICAIVAIPLGTSWMS